MITAPTVPVVAVIVQANVGVETVTLPHPTAMPLQVPELALTLTGTLPAVVGVRFAGVHVRPVVTVLPLQVTVGTGEIVVPTHPVVAVISQANVGGETVMLPH